MAPSGEGGRAIERAPPPLSSSPFPTGLLHRAWVGLWNVLFAHDLPLIFLSGVQLGAPQHRKYIRTFLLSPMTTGEPVSQPRPEIPRLLCAQISASKESSQPRPEIPRRLSGASGGANMRRSTILACRSSTFSPSQTSRDGRW